MTLSDIFNFFIKKKFIQNKKSSLTAYNKEGTCSLCNNKDKNCKCTILDCHCNISAIICKWPDCLCESCFELPKMCRCKNEK